MQEGEPMISEYRPRIPIEEISPEDFSEISENIQEISSRVLKIISRTGTNIFHELSERNKFLLRKILESTGELQAISKEELLNSASTDLSVSTPHIKELRYRLEATGIQMKKIVREDKKSTYYYLTTRKIEDSSSEDYPEPLIEMEDQEWEYLPIVLENVIQRLRNCSHVFSEILKLLIQAAKNKKAISVDAIKMKILKKHKKFISNKDLEQSLLFAQIDKWEFFKSIGLNFLLKDNVIQAYFTKDSEEIDENCFVEIYEPHGSFRDYLDSAIPEIKEHFDENNKSPIDEILTFMLSHRPTTVKSLVKAFSNLGLTEYKAQKVIAHIKYLNSLLPDYSPIKLDIYGSNFYYLGKTKKTYLQPLGSFSFHETNPINSLYPKASSFDFNYSYFTQLIEKHLPHLAYSRSMSALLVKIIAGFSAMQFKVSFPIIYSQIIQLNPEIQKESLIPALYALRKEVEKALSGHNISLKNEDGYYFETFTIPSPMAQRFRDWPDYILRPGSKLPWDFIEENEQYFIQRPTVRNDLNPIIRSAILKLRDRIFSCPPPKIETKQVYLEEFDTKLKPKIEEIIKSVFIYEEKMGKKTTQENANIILAIIKVLLDSTIRGKCMFYSQIVSCLSSFYDPQKIDDCFESIKQILKDSKTQRLVIKSVRLKTKVDGQNTVYHLDLK